MRLGIKYSADEDNSAAGEMFRALSSIRQLVELLGVTPIQPYGYGNMTIRHFSKRYDIFQKQGYSDVLSIYNF
jgi:hypothetical protein